MTAIESRERAEASANGYSAFLAGGKETASPWFAYVHGHEAGQDQAKGELLRLLLVIDAEAGSEYADREAERLGLTIQLAVARERRAMTGLRKVGLV